MEIKTKEQLVEGFVDSIGKVEQLKKQLAEAIEQTGRFSDLITDDAELMLALSNGVIGVCFGKALSYNSETAEFKVSTITHSTDIEGLVGEDK